MSVCEITLKELVLLVFLIAFVIKFTLPTDYKTRAIDYRSAKFKWSLTMLFLASVIAGIYVAFKSGSSDYIQTIGILVAVFGISGYSQLLSKLE